MKKEYLSPEWDLLKLQFENTLQKIQHSKQEDFSDDGNEGPDE